MAAPPLGVQGWARQMSLAQDFDCAVENGVIIRYIIEAEAINRNPKRDAVVVPTLPRTKGRAAIFFSVFILSQNGCASPQQLAGWI